MTFIQLIYKAFKRIRMDCFFFLFKKRFKYVGKGSVVLKPLKIDGIESISIGENVTIHEGAWLAAVPLCGDAASLILGDGTILGHNNHIYATKEVIVGKNVLTADKVYIGDNSHSYEDVNIPISQQPIKQLSTVRIGDDSWLGENVCIIGASIGKHCVIGANSVVTKDIPDYCVAVGSPAKVIRKYDPIVNRWEKV